LARGGYSAPPDPQAEFKVRKNGREGQGRRRIEGRRPTSKVRGEGRVSPQT